jgi:transcriptional regulator with XRE-family HTH domain
MSTDLGNRLRSLRRARGLSQEAVARQTNIGLKAYGDLERGRTTDPHYSTLEGIAHALGVTVAELTGEEAAVPLGEDPRETGPAGSQEEVLDTIWYFTPEGQAEAFEQAAHVAAEARSDYDAVLSGAAGHRLVLRDDGQRIEVVLEASRETDPSVRRTSEPSSSPPRREPSPRR